MSITTSNRRRRRAHASLRQARRAAGTLDHDDLIEVRIAGHHRRGLPFHQVGERGVREPPPQRADHRRRQYDVADEAEADEKDAHGSRLDGGLVEQHDGDVVPDRVHAFALPALECGSVLDEVDLRLAVRAGKDFQEFRIADVCVQCPQGSL
jgi:hypothetical protein